MRLKRPTGVPAMRGRAFDASCSTVLGSLRLGGAMAQVCARAVGLREARFGGVR